MIVAGLSVMLIGSTAWAAACDGFTDVDSANATYCTAVTYLKNKGITLGRTGTTYIGGGSFNKANGAFSAVAGAQNNQATGTGTFTGGGTDNQASGGGAAIRGGATNTASGNYSTIAGVENAASAVASVVLGYKGLTTAAASGSFVFSDFSEGPGGALFGAGEANIFIAGATDGSYLHTNRDFSSY